MRKNFFANRHRTAGLTLVEILVAMVVISVGLLGVAGLHAMSLRNNYDALMRSHASALASDIADRMRANRAAALDAASEYEIALTDKTPALGKTPSIAAVDKYEWRTALSTQLPQGNGSVSIDPVTRRIVTITIQWGERDQKDPVTFATETEI